MNKRSQNLKTLAKGHYIIKLISTLTFIVSLSLLFVSCQTPPEPIRMFDMNSITSISYQTSTSRNDINIDSSPFILSKANANDTENYMLLKNIIQEYETQVFNTTKANEIFSNNLDIDHAEFIITFNSISNDLDLRNYELYLNMTDTSGTLKGPEATLLLSQTEVQSIFNSTIIVTDIDFSTLPVLTLNYLDHLTELNTKGVWNYYIYEQRYQTEIINSQSSNNHLSIDGFTTSIPRLTFKSTLPNQLILNIYEDNKQAKLVSSKTLFPKAKTLDLDLPQVNGSYIIETICNWDQASDSSYGSLTYTFNATIETAEKYTLSKESYQPGDLIVLKGNYIDTDLNYTIESNLYNQGLVFQKQGIDYYVFLPIMSKAEVGSYSISITDNDYPDATETINFDIVYKEFDVQYLETSSSTASLQNDDNYVQLNEAFERGRSNLKEEKLWDGKFMQPVGGRISTEYGQIRYTNGSENSSRHSGIDFANPTGTIITATQNGYVTLAEELNITGNTLFIDHGFGIISQYYHTNKILVSVGDYVTTGQSVAEVGTTGFSTGPHLHFAIYYKGIYLNPWKFFEAAPF